MYESDEANDGLLNVVEASVMNRRLLNRKLKMNVLILVAGEIHATRNVVGHASEVYA